MAYSDGPDDAALNAAWAAFCDRLKAAGERVFKDYNATSGAQRVDGFRFLTQNLGQAFDLALETKDTMLKLLEAANRAEGVQIFIGSENEMFAHAGCSMIITPYMNSREQVVGAIGVIGPTRLNYARIIPMVDYTAKVISRLLG